MKELLKEIVQVLVDYPEQIKISEIKTKQSTILELQVAKPDLGKIIGKKGRNVDAIRSILSTASAKNGKRVALEIMD